MLNDTQKDLCSLIKNGKYIIDKTISEGSLGSISDVSITTSSGKKELFSSFISYGDKNTRFNLTNLNVLVKINRTVDKYIEDDIRRNLLTDKSLTIENFNKIRFYKEGDNTIIQSPDGIHEGIIGSFLSYLYDTGVTPNIIKYFGTFQCDDKVYNLIEQCDGEISDLFAHVKNQNDNLYFGRGPTTKNNYNEIWRGNYVVKQNSNLSEIGNDNNTLLLEIYIPLLFSLNEMINRFGIVHMDLHFRNILYSIVDTPNQPIIKLKNKAQKKYLYHAKNLKKVKYFSYKFNNTVIYIPNRGFIPKIADYGFSYCDLSRANNSENKSNFKIVKDWYSIKTGRRDFYTKAVNHPDFNSKSIKMLYHNLHYIGKKLNLKSFKNLDKIKTFFDDFEETNRVPHWSNNVRQYTEKSRDTIIEQNIRDIGSMSDVTVINQGEIKHLIFKINNETISSIPNDTDIIKLPLEKSALQPDLTEYKRNLSIYNNTCNTSMDLTGIKRYLQTNNRELYNLIRNIDTREKLCEYLKNNYKRYDLRTILKLNYPNYLLKSKYESKINFDDLDSMGISPKKINNNAKTYIVDIYPEVYDDMFTYQPYQILYNFTNPPSELLNKNLGPVTMRITEINPSTFNINFVKNNSTSQYHFAKKYLSSKNGFVINGGYYVTSQTRNHVKFINDNGGFVNDVDLFDPVGYFYANNKVENYCEIPYGYEDIVGVFVIEHNGDINIYKYNDFLNKHELEDYNYIIGTFKNSDSVTPNVKVVTRQRIKLTNGQPKLKSGQGPMYKAATVLGALLYHDNKPVSSDSFSPNTELAKYEGEYVSPFILKNSKGIQFTNNKYKFRSIISDNSGYFFYGMKNTNYLVELNLLIITKENKLINLLVDGRAFNTRGIDKFLIFKFLKEKSINAKSIVSLDGGFSANLIYKNKDNQFINIMRDPIRRNASTFITFTNK